MDRRLFVNIAGLFIKSRKQTYYSQFGEDVVIQGFFCDKLKGFYVDVGAHHPRFWSNTYGLYRKGWSGVNIDLHRHNIALFDIDRRRDTNVCAAISDVEADVSLYEFGPISVFNTLSKEDAEKVKKQKGMGYTSRTVKTHTLTSILRQHNIVNRRIDFLSVDVEGHDLAVLRSLDFDAYQPTMICVELHEADMTKIIRNPLYAFLIGKGYNLKAWPAPSLIFVYGNAQEVGAPKPAPSGGTMG